MNQDFVFKKYHVSAAVYPVGMARGAEGTLAPRPDLPSLLTVGWRWRGPQLSLFLLVTWPRAAKLPSRSSRWPAPPHSQGQAPWPPPWLTAAQPWAGPLPPASHLFLTGSQLRCCKTHMGPGRSSASAHLAPTVLKIKSDPGPEHGMGAPTSLSTAPLPLALP